MSNQPWIRSFPLNKEDEPPKRRTSRVQTALLCIACLVSIGLAATLIYVMPGLSAQLAAAQRRADVVGKELLVERSAHNVTRTARRDLEAALDAEKSARPVSNARLLELLAKQTAELRASTEANRLLQSQLRESRNTNEAPQQELATKLAAEQRASDEAIRLLQLQLQESREAQATSSRTLAATQQEHDQHLAKARDEGRQDNQAVDGMRARLTEATTLLQDEQRKRADIEHQLDQLRADLQGEKSGRQVSEARLLELVAKQTAELRTSTEANRVLQSQLRESREAQATSSRTLTETQQKHDQHLAKARDEGRQDNQAVDGMRARLTEATTLLQDEQRKRADLERQLDQLRADLASTSAKSEKEQTQWALLENRTFDFSIRYPARIFRASPSEAGREHRVFTSKDGKAKLAVTLEAGSANQSLADYRKALRESIYANAAFDYEPTRTNWFVLSGTIGDVMFYDRVTLVCRGRIVHRWQLTYPVAQRTEYDRIVEQMHRTYVHGDKGCPA